MVVFILESVPVSLRGELTRWLIEPHPGVFVGHLSAMVRELLWTKCCEKVKEGGVLQLWSMNNEQRFDLRLFGNTRRRIVDFEGLKLIQCDLSPSESKAAEKAASKAASKRATQPKTQSRPDPPRPT